MHLTLHTHPHPAQLSDAIPPFYYFFTTIVAATFFLAQVVLQLFAIYY